MVPENDRLFERFQCESVFAHPRDSKREWDGPEREDQVIKRHDFNVGWVGTGAHDPGRQVDRLHLGSEDASRGQHCPERRADVLSFQATGSDLSQHRRKEQVVALAHEGYVHRLRR